MDRELHRAEAVARSLGPVAEQRPWHVDLLHAADALVLAVPFSPPSPVRGRSAVPATVHLVAAALARGVAVVSVADGISDVEALLALDPAARAAGAPVVVGAAMAPGLTDVLARLGAEELDAVDEVHIAKAGTGGPACAREHHRALGGEALDWRDGQWVRRPGGSGRELAWFPDPLGRPGLLPGRAARRPAAGAGLPRGTPGHRPRGRHQA